MFFCNFRGVGSGAMGELRLLGENSPFRTVAAGKIQPDSAQLIVVGVLISDGKFRANVADGTLIAERERPRRVCGGQGEGEVVLDRKLAPLIAAAPSGAHQVNGEQGGGILRAFNNMVEHMALGDVACGGAGSEFPLHGIAAAVPTPLKPTLADGGRRVNQARAFGDLRVDG